MENFADKVHELIKEGDLESALDSLVDCLAGKNTRLHNEVILHKASLNQNNRSVRQAIITNDNAERVRARINLAVLSLLMDIEKEGIKCGDGREGKANPGPRPGLRTISGRGQDEIKILFFSANPLSTTRIRIDEELSKIETELRMATEREKILLTQRWAVTPSLLLQAILDEDPDMIHFSGHGTDKGIILEDARGDYQLVTGQALENLFSLFSGTLKCVVLNACYSDTQARAIVRQIPYVVGMSSAISDKASISFSTGFYKALGAGKDIEFAYRLGLSSVQLEGLEGDEIPLLLRRE
jgi:Effector-associated domain 11/CHAT domain